MKNKTIVPVKVLLIIFFAIRLISQIANFLHPNVEFKFYTIPYMAIILPISAAIIFGVYIFKFYPTKQKHILLPIFYIVNVITFIPALTLQIGNFLEITRHIEALTPLQYFYSSGILAIAYYIIEICFSIYLTIVGFTRFKGLRTAKKLVLIPSITAFVYSGLDLIIRIPNLIIYHMEYGFNTLFFTVTTLTEIILIPIYASMLLIFWRKAMDCE